MQTSKNFLSVLLYVALVLMVWLAPTILSRYLLYQLNLTTIDLDSEGYVHLANIPMKAGESYTIYLVRLNQGPFFHILPGAGFAGVPNEAVQVDIFDSKLQKIPNLITWYGTYDIFSESAYTIGVYTAQVTEAQMLILKFREPPKLALANYKIVLRQSGWPSNPFLLMLSDGSYLWWFVVIGVHWLWQKIKDRIQLNSLIRK